jgi:hypothetical protein
MPLKLNDLKQAITKFEEEWALTSDLYDAELIIGGQRLTELKLCWKQNGSAEYIELNFHPY